MESSLLPKIRHSPLIHYQATSFIYLFLTIFYYQIKCLDESTHGYNCSNVSSKFFEMKKSKTFYEVKNLMELLLFVFIV